MVPAGWVNHDSVQENIDWWMGTIPAQPAGTQVRYKVALFYGGSANPGQSIQPISDAEISGSKLFGLTQAAITNFNPTTAPVWLHNDLNPANTVMGLQSGFHILRARTFLPRPGQSSVYNTFLQTFYYAGPLPGGVIVYPANNSTVSSSTYTVVVRTDNSVSGVDFNIQDSNPSNDDIVTGVANGNGNDTNGNPIFVPATQVSPSPSLDLQYPNDLQEFRFNYVNVPSSGPAAIMVRLKDYANSLYTNRLTILTNDVTTVAPQQVVQISSPATDGSVIPMSSATTYLIQTCFTSTLDSTGDPTLFTLTINGVLQPRASYIMRGSGAVSGCPGMSALLYNWTANSPGTTNGTNVIQVVYSNTNTGVTLSDTRTVIVPPPLVITGLGGGNQFVLWNSAPNVTYMVLATTNLAQPFQPISGNIPSQGFTTSFLDTNTAPQKFYEIVELAQ